MDPHCEKWQAEVLGPSSVRGAELCDRVLLPR
jgi:hypothetical protein